jgi:hypothetical protein
LYRTQDDADFLPATFGYAVESVACKMYFAPVIEAASALGLKVVLQATRGGSRPDIVLKDGYGKDVAWFDITSAGSVTHIDRKNSTKWLTLPDVAEITYPALDKAKLGLGSSSSSEQTQALIGAAELQVLKQKRADKMKWLATYLPVAAFGIGNTKKRRENTEKEVGTLFGLTKKLAPATTKSLLELGGKNLNDYGYSGDNAKGRNREAALELLISDDDLTIGDGDIPRFNTHLMSLWGGLTPPTFGPGESPLFPELGLDPELMQTEQTIPALPLRFPSQGSNGSNPIAAWLRDLEGEDKPDDLMDVDKADAFVASVFD